jgi:hypothetical protein
MYIQIKTTTIHMGCTIGVRFQTESKYLFATTSRLALGPTQHPNQCVPGTLSLGVKRPKHKGSQSPLSSAEIKNAWSYTSTPPFVSTQGLYFLPIQIVFTRKYRFVKKGLYVFVCKVEV